MEDETMFALTLNPTTTDVSLYREGRNSYQVATAVLTAHDPYIMSLQGVK
jgi:hypothetical protein